MIWELTIVFFVALITGWVAFFGMFEYYLSYLMNKVNNDLVFLLIMCTISICCWCWIFFRILEKVL